MRWAVGPAQLLEGLYERHVARLPFRIVRGQVHEHADATNPIGLLRARSNRAAKQRDELTAFEISCPGCGAVRNEVER